jgi:hypothetical protein
MKKWFPLERILKESTSREHIFVNEGGLQTPERFLLLIASILLMGDRGVLIDGWTFVIKPVLFAKVFSDNRFYAFCYATNRNLDLIISSYKGMLLNLVPNTILSSSSAY